MTFLNSNKTCRGVDNNLKVTNQILTQNLGKFKYIKPSMKQFMNSIVGAGSVGSITFLASNFIL